MRLGKLAFDLEELPVQLHRLLQVLLMTLIARYLAEVNEAKLVIPLIHLPPLRCDSVDVRQYVTHYLNRGRILGVEDRIDWRLYA